MVENIHPMILAQFRSLTTKIFTVAILEKDGHVKKVHPKMKKAEKRPP